MYNIYKMIDEPELYNFRTEKIDKITTDNITNNITKRWQIVMEEVKKAADFNNLATEYFGE